MDQHYLTPLFAPSSIAVFAGNPELRESDPAYRDAKNLYEALTAQRYAGKFNFLDVDTTEGRLADLINTGADLALVALPPHKVMAALEVAGRIRCKAALIISTGITAEQASELRAVARRNNMFLMGPNSRGFQRPHLGLNSSIVGPIAEKGPLALVSQSGALTSALLDWARPNKVGFSTVISLGPHTAVDMAQTLDFLAADPQTHSIVVYLEGIKNARNFMSALRAAAIAKPVVVLKAGRKQAGNVAARTHSAAIVGSDEVFDAALRRGGAVRIRSFTELFSAVQCLASRYRPVGKRLAIITNGGGPGVLAADRANDIGLELGHLSDTTINALKPKLLPQASLVDLMDLTEDASAEHFLEALRAAASDPGIDGVLTIHTPKIGADMEGVATAIAQERPKFSKPLISCVMGDASVHEARGILNNAGIPTFRSPEAAVGAFGNIASYYHNQKLLQQTPPPLTHLAKPDVEGARMLLEGVLAERRQILTEMESKALLSAFHIPVTQTILARSATEAMMLASQLGFPVALKIDSPDIAHKSDVNGVALNIMNAVGVRDVFEEMMENVARKMPKARINGVSVQRMARHNRGRELYIGVVTDEPFGPVIAFGAGGTMVELYDDRAMELPPLNQFLARHMIERSRVSATLDAWRGATPVNRESLEQVLLRVSEMVCELPQLREMDINPIIVDEDGAVAVDARIVVGNTLATARPYQHLSILPYPAQFEQQWPLPGGGHYIVRPIHPDDAEMLQELVRGLKPESRYNRFVSALTELSPNMLSKFTLIDYDREMALVAILTEKHVEEDGSVTETQRIVGSARYVTNPDSSTCEFSLLVADDMSGKGMGSRLMRSIMDVAREKGLSEIIGLVLTNNSNMLKLMRALGFTIKAYPDDPDFRLVTHQL
ncbi:MAG: bifunctional acetate--CoA ligase family protein/GNAT family N-acetyltransferase [Brachymonas denitrificans]|uniref:bifunctional acetate--CoA ligase family protein/GNAT family N-acetyltransferase n=1 Tax=Brachymonas denitrificans TaxID=28220 RepID=UPI001BCC6910|nr:bifunctional acetate--CoA ligase family protein/GNAT family N-acetyltransferase [Brachymonas denitrificans]